MLNNPRLDGHEHALFFWGGVTVASRAYKLEIQSRLLLESMPQSLFAHHKA